MKLYPFISRMKVEILVSRAAEIPEFFPGNRRLRKSKTRPISRFHFNKAEKFSTGCHNVELIKGIPPVPVKNAESLFG
jgi:hypothetical protein